MCSATFRLLNSTHLFIVVESRSLSEKSCTRCAVFFCCIRLFYVCVLVFYHHCHLKMSQFTFFTLTVMLWLGQVASLCKQDFLNNKRKSMQKSLWKATTRDYYTSDAQRCPMQIITFKSVQKKISSKMQKAKFPMLSDFNEKATGPLS